MTTFFNMTEVTGEEQPDLRGTVTDTLGSIANAVGKEKFLPYMDSSFSLAFSGLKLSSSRLRESAFCFFAVIAAVLKEELAHVLPQIMPPIFETLNQEDMDFGERVGEEEAKALLNGDISLDEIESDDSDDESIQFNVNSALQLEKEIAADACGEIFVNVKEAFLPYLPTATEQLAELADTFYEGARKAAISALWKFVTTLGELLTTEPWQAGLPVVRPRFGSVVLMCRKCHCTRISLKLRILFGRRVCRS
jgi:importin-4